jgi:hypothetical protein
MIHCVVARPRNQEATVLVEIGFSPKTIKYLDMLKDKEGFGSSRPEIVRNFVWKEINRLIEAARLPELE